MKTTMVQLKKSTANRLKMMKSFERQSYDEVLVKLITEAKANE